MERSEDARELLDGPLEPDLLAGNLRDLSRVNRWLGGAALSWRALRTVLADLPTCDAVSLLDVGTGAADIPRELVRRAAGIGCRLEVEATDVRPEIVSAARELVAGVGAVNVSLVGDSELDHPDASFDVVHCSLVLHHLDPEPAGRLLAEMARVARRAVIVNDLDRAWRWWLAAWLMSHLATANPYTRHDAPLSVRRAYRPPEVATLAAEAGLREIARFGAFGGHRYAFVFGK